MDTDSQVLHKKWFRKCTLKMTVFLRNQSIINGLKYRWPPKGALNEFFCQVKISFRLPFLSLHLHWFSKGWSRGQNSYLCSLGGKCSKSKAGRGYSQQTQRLPSLSLSGHVHTHRKPAGQITPNLMNLMLLWEPLWFDLSIEGLLKLYTAQHTEPGSVTD